MCRPICPQAPCHAFEAVSRDSVHFAYVRVRLLAKESSSVLSLLLVCYALAGHGPGCIVKGVKMKDRGWDKCWNLNGVGQSGDLSPPDRQVKLVFESGCCGSNATSIRDCNHVGHSVNTLQSTCRCNGRWMFFWYLNWSGQRSHVTMTSDSALHMPRLFFAVQECRDSSSLTSLIQPDKAKRKRADQLERFSEVIEIIPWFFQACDSFRN